MVDLDPGRLFLEEVLASPEDDAPRLIYADYLEEQGDPRGEFIRLQCELDRLDSLDTHYLDVLHRCSEILQSHQAEWADGFQHDVRKIGYTRGFIQDVSMRARAFLKDGANLYRSSPIHWLRLLYLKGSGERIAASEALQNVRALDLAGLTIPDQDLVALLTSSNLSHVESLNFSHYEMFYSGEVGAALAAMPAAKTIRWLEIPCGDEFLHSISRGDGFPKLEHLGVGTAFAESGLAGLANLQVPSLTSLKCGSTLNVSDTEVLAQLPVQQLDVLNLRATGVPARGLLRLAERGALDSLRTLNLRNCGLGIRTADVLFAEQRLGNCESLDLSLNRNLGQGRRPRSLVEHLVAHEAISRLKHLSVSGLLPGDLSTLAACPRLAGLRTLALDSSQLGAGDLAALADSPIADSLQKLSLISCDASLEAIISMAAERPFPHLISLEFGGSYDDLNTFDDLRVGAMAESGSFPALQLLVLDDMELKSETLRNIADSAELPELRQISFRDNETSPDSIQALMTSPRIPKLNKLLLTGASHYGDRLGAGRYGSRVEFL
ncbi:MAG: TIGR02996 domain-containing protein [Rubripirellula sp.]